MKARYCVLLIGCLLLSYHVGLNAQLTPQEAVPMMLRGINLGNSLDAVPGETSWGNGPIQEHFFDDYKEAGFKHVRIPITWRHHVDAASPYTIDSTWFDRVDTVVSWALSKGLLVTINMHHEDGLKAVNSMEPAARADTLAKYDSIWSQVATRFQDRSDSLLFEIKNEPQDMELSTLDSLNARILSIIRKTNPTRIVLFSGTGYTSGADLMNAAIPDTNDAYLMAYYHSYDPWTFAGEAQGTFGSTGDINSTQNRFIQMSEWSQENDIPVTLNETGAVRDCDYNSRMIFYATYVEFALKYNIPFSIWDDNGDFRLYDRANRRWDAFKDVVIYTYDKSPTKLSFELSDESAVLRWTNRSVDYDSIVVEKYESGTFDTFAVVSPEIDSLYLPNPEKDVYHYFRLKTHVNDTLMYSYARRFRIASPDGLSGNSGVAESLKIYPNPASDRLVISTDKLAPGMRLMLYNSNGQILNNIPLSQDEYTIDLSGYARGVYFIRVSGSAYEASARFIKE